MKKIIITIIVFICFAYLYGYIKKTQKVTFNYEIVTDEKVVCDTTSLETGKLIYQIDSVYNLGDALSSTNEKVVEFAEQIKEKVRELETKNNNSIKF